MRKIMFILFLCLVAFVISSGCTPARKPDPGQSPPPPPPADSNAVSENPPHAGKLYTRGDPSKPKIALTFDDGPDAHWTPKLLDILKQKKVTATFFVIGENVEQYPDMLKKIYDDGHVIGNHTYTHADLTKLTAEQIASEIDRSDSAIKRVIGRSPALVRPPFGFHNSQSDTVINGKNDVIVLWSTDTDDWQGLSVDTIENRIFSHSKNGMIILQHCGPNPKLGNSLEAVPVIIDTLRARGYEFVSVPDLLNVPAYHETPPDKGLSQ